MKPLAVADAMPRKVAAGAIGVELGHDINPPASDPIASARAGQSDAADRIARLVIIALFSFMAVRIGADYLETGRLTGLLLLASEALVVVLTVFRRTPVIVDRSLEARVLTTMSVLGPPMVRPSLLEPLMPEAMTVAFSACGLLVVIGGKLSLGRSFGLMPANRGIVSSGLYRIVRHPIYMGYLVTHAAFIAANPSPWNLVVLVMADAALLARALCEERTLARDPEYRQYQGAVRWRVVPGLF